MRLVNCLRSLKLLKKKNLESCLDVDVEDFCRRRLSQIIINKKMINNMKDAVRLIEQGQISIGVKVLNNPNILITENLEKYVKWSLGSKIKRKVDEFNEGVDEHENYF